MGYAWLNFVLTNRPASLFWILTNVLISLRLRKRESRKSFDFRFPKFTLSSQPLHSQVSPMPGKSGTTGAFLLFGFLGCLLPFLLGIFRFLLLLLVVSNVVIWLLLLVGILLFKRTLCLTRFLSHEHSTNSPIEQAFAIV